MSPPRASTRGAPCGDIAGLWEANGQPRAGPDPSGGQAPRTTLAAGDTQANEARGGFCQVPPQPQRGDKPLALHWLRGAHRRMRLVADFARSHPNPSGGQAPRTTLAAGETQANEARGGFCQAHPDPSGGQAPRTTLAAGDTQANEARGGFCQAQPNPSRGQAPALHWLRGDTQANEARGGFCQAPPQPQRGTSPSPRVVFDRTTLAAGDTQANEARGGFCHAQPNPSRGQAPRTRPFRPCGGTHRRMRLVEDFARPHPGPSRGQAPALHWLRGTHRRMRLVADFARPNPGPSGGRAPRLAKSSTALHSLVWT